MDQGRDERPAAASIEAFLALRPRMLGIAYRMLGSAGDAEDVLQEAWERWQGLAGRQPVDDAGALLSTITTRLCVDRYRRERARRETYPDAWLPEPVPTTLDEPFEALESERLLGFGLLWVLEQLTPQECAAFVLAEAFDYSAREIGAVLQCSEANSRQLLHRARKRLASSDTAGLSGTLADAAEGLRVLKALMDAVQRGAAEEAAQLLADDVAFLSDGGGRVSAVTRPVAGVRAVLRLLMGQARQLLRRTSAPIHPAFLSINGSPALVLGGPDGVETVLALDVVRGRVRTVYVQRNPDKLSCLDASLSGLQQRQGDASAPASTARKPRSTERAGCEPMRSPVAGQECGRRPG